MIAARKPVRIIVADDEPFILQFYKVALPSLGHQVACVARDGQELVNVCGAHHPELVITDVNMPIMDGIEASRRLCEQMAVPVIIVSGFHSEHFLQMAKAETCHISAYLLKPVTLAKLEETIEAALEKFEQEHPEGPAS